MVVSYAGVTDRVDCPEFGLLSYQDPLKGICRGFKAKDKVKTPRGNGAVVGVADGRLWVDTTGVVNLPVENSLWGNITSKLWRLRSIQIERLADYDQWSLVQELIWSGFAIVNADKLGGVLGMSATPKSVNLSRLGLMLRLQWLE
ncbi:hypothetical protein Ae201684_007085 [Aphanomyces euteiches]|uniref:Uncharacterized protein n=1 Tax=Aphanomyces euteiches TaxID=100861 RepID=A0A6G0X984_9STRA|nr:hypothetical protein Ae201684_007085 [Aphanomyces euteiches]